MEWDQEEKEKLNSDELLSRLCGVSMGQVFSKVQMFLNEREIEIEELIWLLQFGQRNHVLRVEIDDEVFFVKPGWSYPWRIVNARSSELVIDNINKQPQLSTFPNSWKPWTFSTFDSNIKQWKSILYYGDLINVKIKLVDEGVQ